MGGMVRAVEHSKRSRPEIPHKLGKLQYDYLLLVVMMFWEVVGPWGCRSLIM